jgi:putative heme-binding domain-containing protein
VGAQAGENVRRQYLLHLLLVVLGFTLVWSSLATAQAISGHPKDYAPVDIAYGAQLYASQCTECHGVNGQGVTGVNFGRGIFHTAVTDRDLAGVIANGSPGKGMPAFKLTRSELTGVIAYLRNFNAVGRSSVKLGDAAHGRAIFEGKGQCGACHRVGAHGPRFAPDLSDVGAMRSAASILRSLTGPSSQMWPINRPVRLVTRAGRVINGRRLNEDTYSVQLIDDHERLISLPKADLREYVISTVSPMPSYKNRLTEGERADLLAYLLSLKGG